MVSSCINNVGVHVYLPKYVAVSNAKRLLKHLKAIIAQSVAAECQTSSKSN
jgi:hypothetical protein